MLKDPATGAPLLGAAINGRNVDVDLNTAPLFRGGIQYAIDRYNNESVRLYRVLDNRARESKWIGCDEYSAGALTGPLSVGITASYTNVVVGFAVNLTGFIEGRTGSSSWESPSSRPAPTACGA